MRSIRASHRSLFRYSVCVQACGLALSLHPQSSVGNESVPKMRDLKMRDMKMRDQIAGVENAGKVSMESQSVKKCLKVVVFVCRVIPSV